MPYSATKTLVVSQLAKLSCNDQFSVGVALKQGFRTEPTFKPVGIVTFYVMIYLPNLGAK